MLWEWRGIANMDFIQLGGSSRVGEMILARERSGFAGEKIFQVVVDKVIERDSMTTSMIWNQRERLMEIKRILLSFRILPV
ncbi:hypothetical protein Tco_0896981 [Tanacetum coccineum]